MNNERGFTIIEIIIAIIVLTVGLLGLVSTAALVTRMISRGQRTADAAMFAERRLERLRPRACVAAARTGGSDTLWRGSNWESINNWTFSGDIGGNNYRIKIVTRSKTVKNQTRTDSLEATVPCN